MSDPVAFYRNFIGSTSNFIQAMEQMVLLQDRMLQDSGLAAAAAAAANAQGRTDLSAADFTNAANAVVQMNFTYNSGTPAQKSFFYKML